jgi:hypothetical protein
LRKAAFLGLRTKQRTLYPSSIARRATCLPNVPVAPTINNVMGLVIYFNVYEKNLNRISSVNKTLQIFQQTRFRIYTGVTKNYHLLSVVRALALILFK